MTLTRRSFLAGAGAGLSQALLGCGGGEVVQGLRLADAGAARLRSPAAGSASVRFCALGDWGHPNETKRSVIQAMVDRGHAQESDFIALLGDNFYPEGIASTRDKRWAQEFEDAFPRAAFRCPFHPLLGNHCHSANPMAQVEYSALSERWRMSAPYYGVSFGAGARHSLDLFLLDTTPIYEGEDSALGQVRWLEDRLAYSAARWKVVAGHHAIYSGGTSGASERLRRHLSSLFEGYGVPLYLCGHNHDLELLDSSEGWVSAVSGSASWPRAVRWTPRSRFASSEPGYVRIAAEPEHLWVEFVTVGRGPCAAFQLDGGV